MTEYNLVQKTVVIGPLSDLQDFHNGSTVILKVKVVKLNIIYDPGLLKFAKPPPTGVGLPFWREILASIRNH
jgi:hypothetical protein